jgi:uncharacterized membrane protein YcaP (DUF421 family)
MAGKAGRSGPKPGNLNAAKSGSALARRRLTVGNLPKELLAVRREGRAYRRALESAVIEAKGEITVTDCHHIDSATGATIQAGICRHLLRTKIGEMKTADVLNCTQTMTRAKQARDKAVLALALDRDQSADLVNLLYGDEAQGGDE